MKLDESLQLHISAEEMKKSKRGELAALQTERKAVELCAQTKEALQRARANRLLELPHWQSLKMELEKLMYLLGKLARELERQREGRKNS